MKSGFVAIVGRPNSGKSTLLNAVLGAQVSIVTPKAQTTRERVLGILSNKRGQMVFVDTPGIHRAKEGGLNEFMVAEAREALDGPSAIWYLVAPGTKLEHEAAALDLLQQTAVREQIPIFVLFNKVDLTLNAKPQDAVAPETFERVEREIREGCEARGLSIKQYKRVSARAQLGLSELLKETWELLEEGEPYYPDAEQLSDRPTRFFVGEMIREQLFLQLGEEVPYSCAVEIELFDEAAKPPRIEAIIHVERESQKGIVIGSGGQKIRDLGTAARKKIEEFLGHPVFLGLRVKVLKDWTKDSEALKRMGYNLPAPAKKKTL